MAVTVINLERSADRLHQFMRTNAHLRDVHRFNAIDSREISREDLRRKGLLEGDPDYTPGAIGNFLSHVAQWKDAILTGEPRTVAEDDAVFSYDFDTSHRALLQAAGAEWDFIIWGWNFDAYLWVDLIPGVSAGVIQTFEDQLRSGIVEFQFQCSGRSLFKLLHFFGVFCYSVSPKGARRLCDFCLPLRPMLIPFPRFDVVIENRTVDHMMNGVVHQMNAFVCIPPLVVSANRHETSTVVRG